MTERLLILSTCGTSLFTNCAGKERRTVNRYSNCRKKDEIPEPELTCISHVIDTAQTSLLGASTVDARLLSAELNGLLGYLQDVHGTVHHILLHTDTWLGREAAELVRTWLSDNSHGTAELMTESGLHTRSLEEFQFALSELTPKLLVHIQAYKAQRYRIILNLTGGFKSINGYLQTVGTFCADEQFYLFEGSTAVMVIPRLPIRLDRLSTFKAHLLTYRRLALRLHVDLNHVAALPETMLVRLGSDVALSAWGELLWKEARPKLYEKEILPPPSIRISYSPNFCKSLHGLSAERLRQLNERMDDLGKHLETGQEMPKSATFKTLAGTPKPGLTHEIYAWSDAGAKRLFGAFEQDVFVVDHLGDHL